MCRFWFILHRLAGARTTPFMLNDAANDDDDHDDDAKASTESSE